MNSKYIIEKLADCHIKNQFSSSVPELDTYLQKQAGQDERRRISVCYVLLQQGTTEIIGYYTLASTSIQLNDLPELIKNKLPRYPLVPATLLGRLAIDHKYHGKNLGELLLIDALKRCYQLSHAVGSAAVIVEAKSSKVVNFYENYGFIQFPKYKQKLFIPMLTIQKSLASSFDSIIGKAERKLTTDEIMELTRG